MAHGIPIGDAGEEVARERPPRMWSLYLHILGSVDREGSDFLCCRMCMPIPRVTPIGSSISVRGLTETIKEGCYLWENATFTL